MNQGLGSRPNNCAQQSEAFDKLCRRPISKKAEESRSVPKKHGLQHLQGAKNNNAVTQEIVEKGVTCDYGARAKMSPFYDESIRDYHRDNQRSDKVRYPAQARRHQEEHPLQILNPLSTQAVHAQSQEQQAKRSFNPLVPSGLKRQAVSLDTVDNNLWTRFSQRELRLPS